MKMGRQELLGAFDPLRSAENAAPGPLYRPNSRAEGIKAYIPQ